MLEVKLTKSIQFKNQIMKIMKIMKTMNFFKQTHRLIALVAVSMLLFSCSSDDSENVNDDPSVNIEEGRISFNVSGFEDAFMEGDVDYVLSNSYNTKYLVISNEEHIMHNGRMWNILIEQKSEEDISLPEPGDYPIVQGSSDYYSQGTFTVTVSMFTDTMTDTGTHFGGNSGEVSGTLKIVSIADDIIRGTFSFEAHTYEGEKITVRNGEFAAPKNSW